MDQEEDDGLPESFRKYRRRKSLYKILTELVPDRMLASADPPFSFERRESRRRQPVSYRQRDDNEQKLEKLTLTEYVDRYNQKR